MDKYQINNMNINKVFKIRMEKQLLYYWLRMVLFHLNNGIMIAIFKIIIVILLKNIYKIFNYQYQIIGLEIKINKRIKVGFNKLYIMRILLIKILILKNKIVMDLLLL